MQAAARSGQTEIVKLLLDAGGNVNILKGRWSTPLRAAIVCGCSETVQLLIDFSADDKLKLEGEPNLAEFRLGSSPNSLKLSLALGNIHVFRALLSADPTLIEDTNDLLHPLIMSCREGDLEMTKLLLQASVRAKEHSGFTTKSENASPLHAAVARGQVPLVEMPFSRGANVNMETGGLVRYTPLNVAVDRHDIPMVRLLLRASTGVNHMIHLQGALSRALDNRHDFQLRRS